MQKKEIISRVAKRANINNNQAELAVNELFDMLTYSVQKKDTFGNIKATLIQRPERKKLVVRKKTKKKP